MTTIDKHARVNHPKHGCGIVLVHYAKHPAGTSKVARVRDLWLPSHPDNSESKRRIMATVQKLCAEGICMTGSYHPDEMDMMRDQFTIAAIVVRRVLERMPARDLDIEWSHAARSQLRGVDR